MEPMITISTEQESNGFYVAQFKTPQLAAYTYYLESKQEAIIIDPTYDTNLYKDLLTKRNSTLKAVLLTHYQADYLSGHTQFNTPIMMGPHSKKTQNKFELKELKDGTSLPLGQVKLQVIHTPGHSEESSCFLLTDSTSVQTCLFSGDTLFVGDVGRPDLSVTSSQNVPKQIQKLYTSVQKLAALDANVRIYPGHGNGSSCGKSIGAANFSTIEAEKTGNAGMKLVDKEQFVKMIGVQLPIGKYFKYMVNLNVSGLPPFYDHLEKANHPLSLEEFKDLSGKALIMECRTTPEAIIKGALWIPCTGGIAALLNKVGITPETDIILFAEPGKWQVVAEMLLRIGYFNIRGYNNFTMADWKGESWKPVIIKFDGLKDHKDGRHLDVRTVGQFKQTGIVQNALTLPLENFREGIKTLKGQKKLIVNCRTGVRARTAASMLAQEGIETVVIAETITEYKDKGGINMVAYSA